jgi:H+/Cl- antiporter ClcA
MSDAENIVPVPAFSQDRSFWELTATAVALGVVGALAGLVFLGVTGVGADWYGETGGGWFDGEVWWVGVSAAAGLLVGLLRHYLAMPTKVPGIVEDLKAERIDTKLAPKIVAVSAVSLIGGASLGPEVALAQMGGGAGACVAQHRELDDDQTAEYTLSGMAGAFGGLFSSALMATALVLEIAAPPSARSGRSFYGSVIASASSVGIYFAIAGSVLFGLYDVPAYDYEDWHLFAGVALGILSAFLVVITLMVLTLVKRLPALVKLPTVPLAVLGGMLFGLVGVALPLTNFTGTDQLSTILSEGSTLGAGLLIATLIAKMLTFAISSVTGFIGGPIFPMLFIGGTGGIIVNILIPGLPIGLTFTCMLVAVPGSVVNAPFSLVLLMAILTQVGTVQSTPVMIAVATSFLTISGLKYFAAQRRADKEPIQGREGS